MKYAITSQASASGLSSIVAVGDTELRALANWRKLYHADMGDGCSRLAPIKTFACLCEFLSEVFECSAKMVVRGDLQ